MKKLFVLVTLLITVMSVSAQEQGIAFEKDLTWSKVVKKAKKEKKLIFIDCYTSWCGPCKMLAKDIFTQKEVGEYFNANYINAKYDCEKGEGITLKEKFKVPAYPTLVFYNPMTDEVEHRCVGAGTAEWLVGNGKLAYDKENNLATMNKRYEANELKPEQLGTYLNLLRTAYMQDKQSAVATNYLETLTAEQLAEKENWTLLAQNVTNIQSKPMMEVMDKLHIFYNKLGKDVVDVKIEQCLNETAGRFIGWDPRGGEFKTEEYKQLVAYLQTLSFPKVASALNKMYVTHALATGNYDEMFAELDNYSKYNFDGPRYTKFEVMAQLRKLIHVKDEKAIGQAIKRMDSLIAVADSPFDKANLFETKAGLQSAISDNVGAEQSKQQAKKYDEEGKKQSGGKVMRAVMMN
ncbi:MAG: thioredoxin family protein [Marinifilaceae bacterium]